MIEIVKRGLRQLQLYLFGSMRCSSTSYKGDCSAVSCLFVADATEVGLRGLTTFTRSSLHATESLPEVF